MTERSAKKEYCGAWPSARMARSRRGGATGIFNRALDIAGELSRSGTRQQQERDEHLDEEEYGTGRDHVELRHITPSRSCGQSRAVYVNCLTVYVNGEHSHMAMDCQGVLSMARQDQSR